MKTAYDYIMEVADITTIGMQEKYRDKPTISINECFEILRRAKKDVIEDIKASLNENSITGYLWEGNPKEFLPKLNKMLDDKTKSNG